MAALGAAIFVSGHGLYTAPMSESDVPHPVGTDPRARRIFLIGPMGSGKSAVGKALARKLKLRFIDSDAEIERRTGVDIPFIFEKEGEAGFRQREREVIAELTEREGIVLATGGGAVLAPESRERLQARGVVIYLETSVSEQLRRTQRTNHRPLLKTGDPEERLRELLRVREPLYRSIASFVVPTDRCQVARVVDRIIESCGLKGVALPEDFDSHEVDVS
jgi:shikimate kinase